MNIFNRLFTKIKPTREIVWVNVLNRDDIIYTRYEIVLVNNSYYELDTYGTSGYIKSSVYYLDAIVKLNEFNNKIITNKNYPKKRLVWSAYENKKNKDTYYYNIYKIDNKYYELEISDEKAKNSTIYTTAINKLQELKNENS